MKEKKGTRDYQTEYFQHGDHVPPIQEQSEAFLFTSVRGWKMHHYAESYNFLSREGFGRFFKLRSSVIKKIHIQLDRAT